MMMLPQQCYAPACFHSTSASSPRLDQLTHVSHILNMIEIPAQACPGALTHAAPHSIDKPVAGGQAAWVMCRVMGMLPWKTIVPACKRTHDTAEPCIAEPGCWSAWAGAA